MKSFTLLLCSAVTANVDLDICDNFIKAHEYMSKEVVGYATCFSSHFFFSPTRKVCREDCLEPLIQASQLVKEKCNRPGLTAEEYDAKYKSLSYIPWSDRLGAEAACAKDPTGQTCMFAVQKAETLITNNLGSSDYSESKQAVICSPCVKSLYTLYSPNPNNYPLVYFHQINDPEAIFKKIQTICKFEAPKCTEDPVLTLDPTTLNIK
ncbi:hypothetical protein DSO57_1021910 [Entomophthora muscae]|uniref:Uncharacterized protein n=1 Tax=Entomophthora muscae TaxID=34485 RepID=A0ACC2SSJ5_9FUNG|nr:hypothetical protein DSO57_1021910 [Entomophthora muscae]